MLEFILLSHTPGKEHFEFNSLALLIVLGVSIGIVLIAFIIRPPRKTKDSLNHSSGIHTDSEEEFIKVFDHLKERGYTDSRRDIYKAWIRIEKGESPQTVVEMHIERFLSINKEDKPVSREYAELEV